MLSFLVVFLVRSNSVVGSERLKFPQDLASKLSRSFDMSGECDQQSLLMDGEGSQMPRRRQSMQRLAARGMPTCGDLQEVNEDGMVNLRLGTYSKDFRSID
jgi:hypothetical protein